jgi:DNA-binding response OmpR family regulator
MRILLLEDELDLGEAVRRLLRQEGYIVDWVQSGADAWTYLSQTDVLYAVAILDWMVPEISGLDICRRLRSQPSTLPILMLTARDTSADKVQGLDAGADDYLVKPFGSEEFLARVRALQRRSPQFQARQLQMGDLLLDYGQLTIAQIPTQQSVVLTPKEFQLLEFFLRHPNHCLTRLQLLDQLWDADADPGSNVVAAQMRLLRRKLAAIGYDQLIETVQYLTISQHLINLTSNGNAANFGLSENPISVSSLVCQCDGRDFECLRDRYLPSNCPRAGRCDRAKVEIFTGDNPR